MVYTADSRLTYIKTITPFNYTMSTVFKLNTGAQIPAIGFGTWQDADTQEGAVREAISTGYRHIDTAQA